MAATRFLKWFNFALYLFLNIVSIFICSSIPEDIFKKIENGDLNIVPISNIGIFLGALMFTVILQVVYIYYRLVKLVRNEEKFRIYPADHSNHVISTAKVPLEEIIEMIKNISEKLDVSLKAVYISRQTIPELFSFDLIPFPRKFSYMVLNESALEISSKQELKCLIAHEIAHIKNHDSTIRIIHRISRPFLAIAYLYLFFLIARQLAYNLFPLEGLLFFNLANIFIYVLMLLTLIVIVFILTRFQSYFIDTAHRQAVFLSDMTAVKLEGKNATINMLVKQGQRSEALDVLLEEIIWLEKREKKKAYQIDLKQIFGILDMFPRGEISEQYARNLAPTIYLRSRFMILDKFYLCKIPGDIQEEVINEASKLLKKKREEEIDSDELLKKDKEIRVERTIDWREVDKNGNLNLDDDEIDDFVKMLYENPSKLLFENELATHGLFKNYPSFRDRIMFIIENYEEIELVTTDSTQSNPEDKDL
ncbi:MAG: M48 family metallopeptidase [Candidatus Hodarchaeales archaeon]